MPEPSINISDPATPPDAPVAVEPRPPTEASITLLPQECLARAEQALSQTQERIRALGEQLAASEPRRADLAERERQAVEAADLLARQCAVQPNLINAAQARLLVVVGTPAEASAQQALSAAREHAEKLAREEAEARAVLGTSRAEAARAAAELDASASRAEAERAGLVGLVEHLQVEVAEARRAVGEELLAATAARAAVLRAEVEAAEAQLAEARAAQERHQAETATVLSAYLEAHDQARQTGLLARSMTQVEQALEAKLTLLRILQRGGWEVEAIDRWPSWEILGDQTGFRAAIAGANHAYWTSRIQSTDTWLASFRQYYRADQR